MRIATRTSALALAQANYVARLLTENGAPDVELVRIRTSGDRQVDRPLAEIGGLGVFTREIEEALLRGDADLAVHSLKDLPTVLPAGLALAAVPVREDVRDALITYGGEKLAQLAPGSRVGSSSLRRCAQLLAVRPDLQCVPIRGNVPTRLAKVTEGAIEAVVLAMAGLNRLDLAARVTEPLDPQLMLPAVGQGALGLETRVDDEASRRAVERLSDSEAFASTAAERELLRVLGGGCRMPLGAWGRVESGKLLLDACACSADGRRVLRARAEGRPEEPVALGARVASLLEQQGARELLAESPEPGIQPAP